MSDVPSDLRRESITEPPSKSCCCAFRFAFTVIWEMTRDAKIVNTRFMKSVICSKVSLSSSTSKSSRIRHTGLDRQR